MSQMEKSPITCHVLDSSIGRPASGVKTVLHGLSDTQTWQILGTGETNSDGRCLDLLPPRTNVLKAGGVYKIVFETRDYYKKSDTRSFYPWVEVVFEINNPEEHYHVPLLLSPHSYTTYRGS